MMFAKRIVTKAVSRNVLFCDACMKMVGDGDDYVVTSFALMKGDTYVKRDICHRDKFIICRRCYETITGAYSVHKQMIADGQEGTFQRDGITEQEMRALLQFNPAKPSAGVAEKETDESVETPELKRKHWFPFAVKLPATRGEK